MHRLASSRVVLGLLCALAIGTGWQGVLPARAEAQTAQELSAQGADALKSGRFADAVKAYDAAYRKQPAPALLYNLALAYKGMGFPGKALQALESYVSYADPKVEGTNIAAAKNELDRIKNGYARFAVKLTPSSATIDIDGKRVVADNGELWVAVGKHTVSIRSDGFESYEQTLDVAAGRFDLEVQLRQATMPPADRAAMLIDEGIALEASGDLAGALTKYQQAEALQSSARGLGQRGLVEDKLNELPDAEMHLKASMALRKDKWVRANRAKMNRALRRISKQLADLEIKGEPEGAEVFVNERSVGLLPILGSVRAVIGSVTVQARKSGYAMYEEIVELPKKAKRTVVVSMEAAPPPVIAAIPIPVAAEPVAAAPAEAPPVEPIAIAPISTEPPPETVAQADIESFSDPREDLDGEPQDARESATGFEAALNFGYHPSIGGPKLQGSAGTLTGQILLGARIIWPLSFGIAINSGFDLGTEGTSVVLAGHPGFYLRGHIQKYKKQLAVDVWGGVGVQPLSLQAAVQDSDASEIDPATVDPTLVTQASVVRLLASDRIGAKRIHTLQSLNIPVELGATLYLTEAVGIDLSLGLTFWLPQQDCLHEENGARYCTSDGLDTQTSFFIGGGFTFLP